MFSASNQIVGFEIKRSSLILRRMPMTMDHAGFALDGSLKPRLAVLPSFHFAANKPMGFVSPQFFSSCRIGANWRQTTSRNLGFTSTTTSRKPNLSARSLTMTTKDQTTATPSVPSTESLLERINPIDFVNGPYVTSPTSEWESLRLFGQTEFDIRIVLYRDHANWCPYCHKVQLLLEAKKIPYVIKKENMNCYGTKSADFLRRNPSGLLPVILLDGELVTESVRIMFLLEETFQAPYTKLIPTEENDKMQAFHRFMRLERVVTGAWLTVLRTPTALLSMSKTPLVKALDMTEDALMEFAGPFFLGTEPSFVDVVYSSILERLSATLKYFRDWDVSEDRPHLAAWYKSMKEWEPARYLAADEYSSANSIPPQIGTVRFMGQRTALSLGIDSKRSVYVLNNGPESQSARDEAGEALCRNLPAVVADAKRGSTMDESLEPLLTTAFRYVVSALIDPAAVEELEKSVRESFAGHDVLPIVSALKFTRQRCCCPRDMTIDGLEQFCGAINWFIRCVGHDS